MKSLTKLAAFVSALCAPAIIRPEAQWRHVGRLRTMDSFTAFQYRMGANFPGVVNRSHPASIEPAQMDPDFPITMFGLACVISAAGLVNSVRSIGAGDAALTKIYGVVVRPYPIQQSSGGMSSSFGTGAPPTDQPLDVCTQGYMSVPVYGTPNKGDPVYVWYGASTGDAVPGTDHIQGGFEAAAGASTFLLADTIGNIEFNGPPDSNGYGEIRFRQ